MGLFASLQPLTTKPARHAGCVEMLADRQEERKASACRPSGWGEKNPYISVCTKKPHDFCQSREWKEEQTRTDGNFAALFLFYLIYNNLEYVSKESGVDGTTD